MFHYFLLQFAQKISIGSGGGQVDNVPQLTGDAVMTNILNAVYFLVGVIAVIVIIVAGLMYAGSGGSANTVMKAKNMILYAVVGIVVSLSAYGITNFVVGQF